MQRPRGKSTRPTSSRVREAIFDILGARIDLDGIRFADLYAGAGAVGIEALSRGAEFVEFVDTDREAVRAIESNLTALGLTDRAIITRGELLTESGFDVIFADPPYALSITSFDTSGLLENGGYVVWENDSESYPEIVGTGHKKSYRYGTTYLHLFGKD